MSDAARPVADAVAALRRAFDQAFVAPPPQDTGGRQGEVERLLAVRVGGDPWALRVRELSALARCPRVVALPARVPALVGLAGLHGALVPVYSLAALLGYDPDGATPRWVALHGEDDPVALGFDELEGYLALPRADLHAASDVAGATEVVRAGAVARPVVRVASVMEAIRSRVGPAGPRGERRG